MYQTKRAEYVFTVKEFADGTPWLAFEPLKEDIEELKGKDFGFDLPKGTDLNKAKEIAEYLNKNITALSCTFQ